LNKHNKSVKYDYSKYNKIVT